MALAETAHLAIDLSLTGNAKAGIAGVQRQLSGLNRQSGQIGQGFRTMGAGIGVAFRNVALLGVAAAGALTAGLIKSVKEGQEAAKVQTIYAKSIANSGKVSTQYVAILNAQQKTLMNLGGVDDELIKAEQTKLVQMGLTGAQVAKLTPLVLDFAKATGIDLLTATKLAGKAVNGNTGALSRYGVMIDKAKAKTDPFAATVDALNSRFGGTTKALSGSLEARLGAFRENLANIREEAGMKLLPALTRIVDVAGKDLVPAFGKFIDRILPSVIAGVDKFASLLENGGAERGIKAITDALGPMVEMLKLAAAPVKLIVESFLKLPSQVQGVLIGAFAVNKLSGGLILGGAKEIAGGLLQRGSSPGNPLYVSDAGLGKVLTSGTGLLLAPAAITALALASGAAIIVALKESGVIDAVVQKGNEVIFGPTRAQEISDFQKSIAPGGNLNKLAFPGNGPGLVGNLGRSGPMAHLVAPLVTIASTLTKVQQELRTDFRAAVAALRDATSPADMLAAVGRLVTDIRGGVGNVTQTKATVADLTARRDAALKAGDKATADALTAAIKQIAPLVSSRQWQQTQIAQGRKIVDSNRTNAQKIKELRGIQSDLLHRQDTSAAKQVQQMIDLIAAVKGINIGNAFTPSREGDNGVGPIVPGRDPRRPGLVRPPSLPGGHPMVVQANVSVSTRDVTTSQSVRGRYGPTPSQAGAA